MLSKSLKRSQTLDDILSHQISPVDKSSLGYESDPSSKINANTNSQNNKDVEKHKSDDNTPGSYRGKEKSQNKIEITFTPRRHADGVRNTRGDK